MCHVSLANQAPRLGYVMNLSSRLNMPPHIPRAGNPETKAVTPVPVNTTWAATSTQISDAHRPTSGLAQPVEFGASRRTTWVIPTARTVCSRDGALAAAENGVSDTASHILILIPILIPGLLASEDRSRCVSKPQATPRHSHERASLRRHSARTALRVQRRTSATADLGCREEVFWARWLRARRARDGLGCARTAVSSQGSDNNRTLAG